MFRCASGHITQPGENRVMIVTRRRDREYINEKGKRSTGWEIVEEHSHCVEHASELGADEKGT